MKTTLKRIIASLLVATLLLTALPMSVFAGAVDSETTVITTQADETTEDDATSDVFAPFASLISLIKDFICFFNAIKAFIDAGYPGLPFGNLD